ncbi:MAG: hypothetical protein WBW47_00120 [Thermoplasmata archaeon]
MKASRVAILLWVALIVVLLIVELAEITHFFTLPVQNAIADPLAFVVALIFTTLLALVGAIFIGVFLSHRILSTAGFTPFEEEMLRMRADLREVKRDVAVLRGRTEPPPDSDPTSDEEDS